MIISRSIDLRMGNVSEIGVERIKTYISYKTYRCTVHFVESLQLLTNNCTYINSTYKHIKTIKITPTYFDLS